MFHYIIPSDHNLFNKSKKKSKKKKKNNYVILIGLV